MSYKKTACCNACKNAGKPRSVFGSHFPKDSAGRTVCPTLLGEKRGFHCKVCKDSGKPSAMFSSHNVKDKTGKVICPTLLSQACLRCSNLGHTINFCNAEKGWREKEVEKEERRQAAIMREAAATVTRKSAITAFSALDLSDSEEEEQTKAEIKMKREQDDVLSQNVTLREHQKPHPFSFSEKEVAMMRSFKAGTLNWADVESDSDEDA